MTTLDACPGTRRTRLLRFTLERGGWLVSFVLAVALVASLAGAVRGGPLDPTGPPGSTMKPLEELPPAWHDALSASGTDSCNTQRFTCVMGGNAVFDRETGLVWQRTLANGPQTWTLAVSACAQGLLGNRWGWRLPTAPELMSLIDTSQSSPALPVGHPFNPSTVVAASFWTSTRDFSHPPDPYAYFVNLGTGAPGSARTDFNPVHQVWCVRGIDPGAS